ncbi:MAG: hypothetical protein K2K32_02910, partial [Muribaculaceae bacterium]|nr:hypothetical protein [Muribaculaceae bacterium]
RKQLGKQLTDMKEQLHGMLDDSRHLKMMRKIDETLFWFERKSTHLGKLFCGLSVCMLVIAGFENHITYKYEYLILVMTLAIIYSIIIIGSKNLSYFIKPWSFLVPLIFLCFILFDGYSNHLSSPFNYSNHKICFIAIIMMLIPVVCLVLAYYWEEHSAKFRWKLMEKLSSEFRIFGRLSSLGNFNLYSSEFSRRLNNLLATEKEKEKKQLLFDQYILENLDEIFRYDCKWQYSMLIKRKTMPNATLRHFIVVLARENFALILLISFAIIYIIVISASIYVSVPK